MSDDAGSLGEAIRAGLRPAVLVFSGQDPDWPMSLVRCIDRFPGVRPWAEEVLGFLGRRLAAAPADVPSLAAAGIDPADWLEHPEEAFGPGLRHLAVHSLIGTSLGHLTACRALAEAEILDDLMGFRATVGHSIGLLSAWAIARNGPRIHAQDAAEVLFACALLGEASARHPVSLGTADLEHLARGRPSRIGMLSVAGLTETRLRALLIALPETTAEIALQNCWDRFVIGGTSEDLDAVAELLRSEPGIVTEAVLSSAPFHHQILESCVAQVTDRFAELGVALAGTLRVPLVDPRDGSAHDGGDLTSVLAESMMARPVRWADTLTTLVESAPTLIDAGPSTLGGTISRRALQGSGATVVSLTTVDGLREFTDHAREVTPLADWSRFLPRVVDVPNEQDRGGHNTVVHRVVTRHTELTQRSAFVLPGMNPTTTDAGIVVAAANAGHVAELAGGGQGSATILSERMTELAEALRAGHEVTFNALRLDPYLWDLHIGRDRMVQRARAAGAPICGVTISAGIPETDEAVALLEELHGLGIWLNAFKPGTVDQVRATLAIAKRIDHDLWLHLEGGRAGGHHSWVELDDLLFATYAEIRRHPNVILCVGGGVGSPERAAELLGGTWALRHCAYPMPVDAVLLGTVAMATRESTASESVKAALVAATGTDELVESGDWRGGMTSGRSSLGADIHCLDTHAAHVAELLDEVAAEPETVTRRHDEIATALAGTAKPWFGDLSHMTYAQMLESFVELCARGRHGRYEDGRWLDHTYRSRFLELLRRTEARCCDMDSGTIRSLFGLYDLDDPDKALALLRQHYPLVDLAELEPTDAAHFVSVCDGPGKPVPFVAIIDAEVRRRFLADSLWQSHSDLWSADEVLVIPGPVALAGITQVDEPVAELFSRFDREVAECLERTGHHRATAEKHPSAIEVLLGLQSLRDGDQWLPSPVLALGQRDEWRIVKTDVAVEATIELGEESACLRGPVGLVGEVKLEIRWPALTELAGDGIMRLGIDVGFDNGVPWARLEPESLAAAQHGALDYVIAAAGQIAQPVLAGPAPIAPSPLVDPVAVPDAVVRVLWPGLFGSLRDDGAGSGLLQLVHAHHRVATLPIADVTTTAQTAPAGAVQWGNSTEVSASIIGHDHVLAGRRIHTRAFVAGSVIEDIFLLRGRTEGTSDDTSASAEQAPAIEGRGWVDTAAHHLGSATRQSPRHPESFGIVSGDLNPIHRSNLLARFTGLPGRIVHGMWTSATAQAFLITDVLGGAAERLRDWRIDFLDMVLPGETVRMTATRTGLCDGDRRVEVLVEGPRGIVASALATVAPPRTAYVFPGQGIQARHMGMDGYDRSAAARDIWNRADAYTRGALGFSLLEVVRHNPERIRVGDVEHRHPAGVLHLTQFTQVAMATLAVAQVEELREAGVLVPGAVLAGHSVGEYNALASIGGVLPLEMVVGIVWARGTAMHHLVERDDSGASRYRLGVVRPHLASLCANEATALVDSVAEDTGELCQVVNHNLRGRQYAVAGTVRALEELERRLGPGKRPDRAPFLLVPGIDVPFHSSALFPGVAEFRQHLDSALPERIDPSALVGRYVPNLHPVPFEISRGYVEAVAEVCGGKACQEILRAWDDLVAEPGRLARELLVELLAWQFASPVRWIETTDVLLAPVHEGGLGVQRLVEIGLGASPTLTNLTSAAVMADRRNGVAVRHVELDRIDVFDTAAEPASMIQSPDELLDKSDLPTDWTGDGDAPGPLVPPAVTGPLGEAKPAPIAQTAAVVPTEPLTGIDEIPDQPVGIADAVAALLAHEAQVNTDQLGDDSVDRLVDGASSRRNQVMMDMSREFGIGAVEGAHEAGRNELASRLAELARSYRFPGPVLSAAVSAGLSAVLGPLGAGPALIEDHVRGAWGLGEGWVDRCRLELFLGSRDGASRRGGSLRTLEAQRSAVELIETALAVAASRLGVTLRAPSSAPLGATVDSAELDALSMRVEQAFAASAGAAAAVLSDSSAVVADQEAAPQDTAEIARLAVLDQEHGADRAVAVAPVFDPRTVAWFSSGIPWARADLDHLFHSLMLGTVEDPERERLVSRLRRFMGTDERFADTVVWHREQAVKQSRKDVAAAFDEIARGPVETDRHLAEGLAGRVVLVSGAAPGSIAESVAARLLTGGATVVMITSSADPQRRRAAREMERRYGSVGAQLYLVRANLASFTDIDRLCDWLDEPAGRPADDSDGAVLAPGLPEVVLPFAAPRVMGDVPDAGPSTEIELRVLLVGVERLVGRLSERVGAASGRSGLTAVLPLSPNHGTFGGDGAYGAAKAGLETLIARKRSEHRRWGRHCRIVAAEIGWVRGTGLMASNDGLAPIVEQHLGVRTWSASEMGEALADLCARDCVRHDVHRADLTGGLGALEDPGSMAELLRNGLPVRNPGNPGSANGEAAQIDNDDDPDRPPVAVLPTPKTSATSVPGPSWPQPPELSAHDMVVVCGIGEVGPWGTSGTRAEVELHRDLSARGVLELALRCGLLEWQKAGTGALVDVESNEVVPEHEVDRRYRPAVLARCGIRALAKTSFEGDAPVFLDRAFAIGVASEAEARSVAAASAGTTVRCEGNAWTVHLPAGSLIRLPRRVELPRGIGAPLPEGMEPTCLGLPVELANTVDPLAAWNLAVSVEAFSDAGTDPNELLTVVHPAKVADTQGCGMGGMASLQGLIMDPVRGVTHANDLLQEALPNVPAAHAMQTVLGGYGSMVHPVGACATTAVSLEVAIDLVRLGKADVVLAGGCDVLSNVGLIGFADMSATADDSELAGRGFEVREMSRPGDRSRAGFVESEGGGALVVCRGSVAVELGLPVRAVLAHASSHADGIQRSIPAPGRGALAAGLGGLSSPLARALSAHGLSADDVAVVSKHDTSTRANDPNEAAIHERLQELLGRSAGNPLRVVSQKSLTGHSKGGAAAWQVAGLCDVFDQAIVPGNHNLDSVDPQVTAGPWLVVDDRPIRLCEPPKAALLTSLGFGHVSAVVLLVHPEAFRAALGDGERERWATRASERRREAARLRRWQPFADVPAFRRPEDRLAGADEAAQAIAERQMLADPAARLGPEGIFTVPVVGS